MSSVRVSLVGIWDSPFHQKKIEFGIGGDANFPLS